ncbi:MAG: hypothetical protein UH077_01420 [Bacteroidales bacterium]|nr:hypothetical protein [Bacteroidales bacterium]
MPFIEDVLKYKSISFVGMEKNAGKTQTLNYVLSRLRTFSNLKLAISSIGVDGETLDIVTSTSKPEIEIYPNTTFITSQSLYNQKEIVSAIEEVSKDYTALGKLITARAITQGKVLLGGPSDTKNLKKLLEKLEKNADLILIDGALSRKSFGSPTITDAMILSTGASLSASLNVVVKKTKFIYQMTQLPQYQSTLAEQLQNIENGIYAITEEGIVDLEIPSLMMIDKYKDKIFTYGKRLFVAGALNDKFIQLLKIQKNPQEIEIIIKDFTKIFAQEDNVIQYLYRGGQIKVLDQTNLIAITANPISPTGYNFNNQEMLDALRKEIPINIYNVKQL